uniref:Dickkopf N-terminal cysteine-rich domain-containing protein n=1 Tax=Gasterosteus aculeatus aculeatus TaxID=481459 RepID=A0AAQ4RVL8_GASAC
TYCLNNTHKSKCVPCKAIDMSCTKDNECCGEQLCVWGQCSLNATKGAAGSTCQYQADCSPDLCCLFHKALFFPVCSAKPIERERCFGASNHLLELLSWDTQDEGPSKHCPCAGDLHCQIEPGEHPVCSPTAVLYAQGRKKKPDARLIDHAEFTACSMKHYPRGG